VRLRWVIGAKFIDRSKGIVEGAINARCMVHPGCFCYARPFLRNGSGSVWERSSPHTFRYQTTRIRNVKSRRLAK